ncbi:MAG: short-chain dehydrogenase [Porticoccaceae bacterium]|nr:MAG: short-chain dehydrogenase [Porticoccaceae bacterium]
MRFLDKVALVTGGARGIGAGICRLLAAEGAAVFVADLDAEAAARLAAELGPGQRALHLDVREERAWQAAMAEVESAVGRLDVLVQCAGISRPAHVEEATLEEWREHMRVHGEGAFLGCKYAIPLMKRTGGAIVNVSSVESIRPGPLFLCYGAAKAAQDAVTKTVALHCAESGYGIRCNSVHPAATYTPLLEEYLRRAPDGAALERTYAAMQPLNRIATVEEVARAVLFLASDEASFITGHQLYVDGGALTRPYPPGQGA